jgi:hypothetical protein
MSVINISLTPRKIEKWVAEMQNGPMPPIIIAYQCESGSHYVTYDKHNIRCEKLNSALRRVEGLDPWDAAVLERWLVAHLDDVDTDFYPSYAISV